MSEPLALGSLRRGAPMVDRSSPDVFSFALPVGEHAPGAARHEIGTRLEGCLDGSEIEAARLLVSELVTNCVVHGADSDADIEVTGTLRPPHLRVEVVSDGEPFDYSDEPVDDDALGGRGLHLVECLSDSWGIRASGSRLQVWFELAGPVVEPPPSR